MAGGQSAPLPVLTDIKSVRELSQAEAARGYPVHIRGIVTHFDEMRSNGLFLYDGEYGQFVVPPASGTLVKWDPIRTGDTIEVTGRTVRGGFAPNVQPSSIHNLGHAGLPPPRHLAYAALVTGRHDCEFVELTGVIRRAWLSTGRDPHTMFADIALEDGIVRAAFWDYRPADLKRFIDARV